MKKEVILVSFPQNFEDMGSALDHSGEVTLRMTAEESLQLGRQSDEAALNRLTGQKVLYIDQSKVPNILLKDIDEYRLRLAITDELGRDLGFAEKRKNIMQLIENGDLYDNRLAEMLVERID